jgi:hypothetical protein
MLSDSSVSSWLRRCFDGEAGFGSATCLEWLPDQSETVWLIEHFLRFPENCV